MRAIGLVLILGTCSLSQAAEIGPFSLTCSRLVVGPAQSVQSAIRFDWDGTHLTTTNQNYDDKLDREVEKVVAARLFASDGSSDVRMSFLTGLHESKAYRYYTSLHFMPSGSGGSLSLMFSTADKDGFLIQAGAMEYSDCQLKFLTAER